MKVRSGLPPSQKMLVWRMSEDSTTGEWVDPIANPASSLKKERLGALTFKVPTETWVSSSFDLLHGCEVSDSPDTVPGDLLDELFAPQDDLPKSPGK